MSDIQNESFIKKIYIPRAVKMILMFQIKKQSINIKYKKPIGLIWKMKKWRGEKSPLSVKPALFMWWMTKHTLNEFSINDISNG